MKSIVHRIPLTKARINLGQVVRRVHVNREYFILEKDGIPVVGIMHVDDLEDYLELRDPTLKRQIGRRAVEYHRGKAREATEFLAELRVPPPEPENNSQYELAIPSPDNSLSRDFRKTAKGNQVLVSALQELVGILAEDPHNRGGPYRRSQSR